MSIQEKAKIKHSKPRMSLIPGAALLWVAKVLTFGAHKYEVDSWKAPPFGKADYEDALLRHWASISEGEQLDPESKLPHSAHLATNALLYLWHDLKEKGL